MKTTEQILAEINRYIQKINYDDEKFGAGIWFGLTELKEFILNEPTEQELLLRDLPSEIEYLKDQIDLRLKLLYKIQNSEPSIVTQKCEHEWDNETVMLSKPITLKCKKCNATMRWIK